MNKTMVMTKEIYNDLVDYTGQLYEKPIGRIGKRELRKESVAFLQNYISFVMAPGVVSKTTQIYLKSSSGSVAAAIRSYNQDAGEGNQINLKTASAAVDYDRKKLLKLFNSNDDMLYNVIYVRNFDITGYRRLLQLAKLKYGIGQSLNEKIILKLNQNHYCPTLSDEDFDDLIQKLVTYSKRIISEVEETMNTDAAGYFNHLQFSDNLSEIDMERLQQIKMLL
ncbi:hypothetical protein [Candidatus Formimonas warabiya]|uniref:Uncharacterized protein n=1 Tax=Formimonas warabiya TaxID=1761012 RepID=A0A3G1KT83_FORW1|nr:hypothetical protein [Candidatus Formimonas warabiya]ATW25637.1 hypothetical protein DCMF_13475 [Candidatus Formimonas warabiya]